MKPKFSKSPSGTESIPDQHFVSVGLLFLIGFIGSTMSLFADTVIGALPNIREALGASESATQQIISLFAVSAACMSLLIGALADAFGRKPVVLGALLILILTSVACAFATQIEHIWLMRSIQGGAACVGMVLSRTIICDLASGVRAQQMIGHISVIQSVFPALMPWMGAWVAAAFGWRMVFVVAAFLTTAMLLVFAYKLPESLPIEKRQPLRPGALAKAYAGVLGSGTFLRISLAQALNWSAIFLYLATAPRIVLVHLQLPSTDIYQLFAMVMLPMLLGFMLSPRLLRRYRLSTVMTASYLCFGVAMLVNLLICEFDLPSPVLMLPLALMSTLVGCTMPILVGSAIAPFSNNNGIASACQMFFQYTLMGITAGVVAPLVWSSLFSLAVANAGMILMGALLLLWERFIRSKAAPFLHPSSD